MSEQYSSHPLIGQTLGERYKVERQIGQGSMGAVFEAKHVLLGRRLAIKVLKQTCSSPRLKERFFNEARAAGAINHQHIVQVYDFGLVDTGEPFIVMEYVEGESLQEYMDRAAPLTYQDAREVVLQILSAIDAIHRIGLVHRDVKPANMMLVQASRPKLFIKMLDFGIARAVNEDWDWPTLTRADEVLGTPVYLSPEQASGGKADPRWDLWAVAIIMYEVLSGHLPFKTESLIQISTDIINHNLTPLEIAMPGLPDWTYDVVGSGLAKALPDRYQGAADFLRALDEKKVGKRDHKSTLTGIPVPDSVGGPLDDDEQPPELPPDVELDEQEPPDGEMVQTDPVYLLQPKGPAEEEGGDAEDDLKETIVQQVGPHMATAKAAGSFDEDAATLDALSQPPPPEPLDPRQEVPVPAQESWSRGEPGNSAAPQEALTPDYTAEVKAYAQPQPQPQPQPKPRQRRKKKGKDTREMERQLKRGPVWLWVLLTACLLGGGGALVYFLSQRGG